MVISSGVIEIEFGYDIIDEVSVVFVKEGCNIVFFLEIIVNVMVYVIE